MAKSVLDLYELYNLVVARGGLVDVINKKLWQEIIKGLHLPSSITSAAFTLRTQYQKHLYEYECHKQRLSTPVELKQAIDGNRREGRRSSYSGENVMQRNQVQHHAQNSLALHPQIQLPLAVSPATHKTQWLNGNTSHTSIPPHPHHPQHPQALLGHNQGPLPGMAPSSELMEYAIKHFNNQLNNVCAPSPLMHRQGDGSPRSSTPPRENPNIGNAVEMLRLTSWYNTALYPNITHQQPLSPQRSHSPLQTANSPEPQREALDLGVRSPASSSPAIQSPQPPSGGSIPAKRDRQSARIPATSIKRRFSSDDESQAPPRKSAALIVQGQRISISTHEGDGANGNSVAVSIDINGITYEGVLFAQNVSNATSPASTTANSNTKTSRST